MEKRRSVKKTKKAKKLGSLPVLAFVAILGVMFVRGAMLQPEINANKQRIAELSDQISYEQKRIEEVNAMKEKTNTDEYIEKVAREKLGLVKENEKIFIDASSQK